MPKPRMCNFDCEHARQYRVGFGGQIFKSMPDKKTKLIICNLLNHDQRFMLHAVVKYLEYIDLRGLMQKHQRDNWDSWNAFGKLVFFVPYVAGRVLLPIFAIVLTPLLVLLVKRS